MNRPLLSICICSFNRGTRVRAQVSHLLGAVKALGDRVELVASNNCSTDRTAELLAPFVAQGLKLHNRTVHFPTAEEHIWETLPLLEGKFVWFLGDDDVPFLSTIKPVLSLIETDEFDFFLFNSLFTEGSYRITKAPFVRMNRSLIRSEFTEGALALGFTSTLAGVSNAIFRSDIARNEDWRSVAAVSSIYSHVAWWLKAFKHRRLAFVNRPLVLYRVESSIGLLAHFSKIAERSNVPDYYFWTTGLMKLIDHLEENGTLEEDQVKRIFEFDREGVTHRLIDQVVGTLSSQMRAGHASESARNTLSSETFEYCADWILRHDPAFAECVRLLRFAISGRPNHDISDRQDRWAWVKDDFSDLLSVKIETHNRLLGLEEYYFGYEIYRHRFSWVAFLSKSKIDRVELLTWIDPSPRSPEFLVAPDRDCLLEQIRLLTSRNVAEMV